MEQMKKTILSQEELIGKLAETSNFSKTNIRKILKNMELILIDTLASSDSRNSCGIKLMNGLILSSEFVNSYEWVDPRNKNPIAIEAKLKPKVTFTSTFKNYINKTCIPDEKKDFTYEI